MNKRGFFGLTVGLVVAITVLVAILFGGLAIFTYVASISLWRLAGVVLLVLAGLHFTKLGGFRMTEKVAMTMLIIGGALVVLPFISDTFNVSLSAIMP